MHSGGLPLRIALAAALLVTVSGCRNTFIPDPTGFAQHPVTERQLLLPLDSEDSLFRGLHEGELVMTFYHQRAGHPVWSVGQYHADSLLTFITRSRYYGLLPQRYHLNELSAIHGRQQLSVTERLRSEVLLTDAFLSLSAHLKAGILHRPDSLSFDLLRDVLSGTTVRKALERQEPLYPDYHGLKQALRSTIDKVNPEYRHLLLSGVTPDIPETKDIRTVEINLERWRREKQALSDWYLFVNIPSFTVEAVRDHVRVFSSRAIVGKPKTQTPVFSSEVQCFVTYPYWHVPRKISVREFLPRIQKDSTFLRRNNFEVLNRHGQVLDSDSIDWKKYHEGNFPVILRQREGAENSMGVIKFVFDNPYAVFLHDTNAPGLFQHEGRALSHGCVRVEKAVELAHLLVTGKQGEKHLPLEGYLKEKARHTIDLPQSVPVHLRYFTAEFRNGQLFIYNDIYKKDPPLIQMLYLEGVDHYY